MHFFFLHSFLFFCVCVFSSSFNAQDAPPTLYCSYITSAGNILGCIFLMSLFLNISHKEWLVESRKAEDYFGHSYKVLWQWIKKLLKQKSTENTKSHSQKSWRLWYNTLMKTLLCDVTFSLTLVPFDSKGSSFKCST